MATTFAHAPEVRGIANELIEKYHPHLKGVEIEYRFADAAPMRAGKELWGTMEIGGEPLHFIMTIVKSLWDSIEKKTRTALVDHYLKHGHVEGADLSIEAFDFEEYADIVSRYGWWRQEVERFWKLAKPKSELQEFRRRLEEMG